MKLKKAMLALVCALALVVGSVMGTMAYLTSQDEVTNTFTVGNVQINLDEVEIVNGVATGERTEKGNQYKLLPNQQYAKDPTVTVLANSEDAYVRALVTVTYNKDADAVLADHDYETWFDFNANWEIQPNVVTVKTDETIARTYEFRYNDVVEASEADQVLPAIFTTITLPGEITNAELETLNDLEINVVAHAIQEAGFADVNAAWEAWN